MEFFSKIEKKRKGNRSANTAIILRKMRKKKKTAERKMGMARGLKPRSRIRAEQRKEKKEKRVMNGGQNSPDLRE